MSDERRLETWQNACRGRIGVLKFDRFGQLKNETIRPGAKVQVTIEERQINSERAATKGLDVFNNGYLVPVKILEDAEDAKEIASNPNLLGEKELVKLFQGTQKAFTETLGGITNTQTLRRLLDMTEDEEIKASVKHQKMIEKRLIELEPDLGFGEVQTINDEPIRGFGAVSPS